MQRCNCSLRNVPVSSQQPGRWLLVPGQARPGQAFRQHTAHTAQRAVTVNASTKVSTRQQALDCTGTWCQCNNMLR